MMISLSENMESNIHNEISEKKSPFKLSTKWEGRLAKSGWVLIHILIYLLLSLRDSTDLNIALKNHNYFYISCTHSILFLTILFYFLSSRNPGHVKEFMKQKQQSTPNINSNNSNSNINSKFSGSSSDNENELKFRNTKKDGGIESTPLIGISDNDKEKDKNEQEHEEEEEEKVDTELDKILFNSNYYCNICEIDIPLRCKHCKRCNQCIVKYDHHCFFIGRCIGIRNHFYFWLFLLFQSILLIIGFQIACTGFRSTPNGTWMDWIWANIIMISPTMLIFGSFFMPGGLFIFHSYLAISNQSSWEFTKHEKITYLQAFYKRNQSILGGTVYSASKQYPYPFSKGVSQNIKEFINGTYQNSLDAAGDYQHWKLPTSEQLEITMKKKKDSFSIWNNKYYSCFG